MHYVRTDELDRHAVTRVDAILGRRVGKLSRIDPKDSLLRGNNWNWQRREGHNQSSDCEEEQLEARFHGTREYSMVRTWNRSCLYKSWHPVDFFPPATSA